MVLPIPEDSVFPAELTAQASSRQARSSKAPGSVCLGFPQNLPREEKWELSHLGLCFGTPAPGQERLPVPVQLSGHGNGPVKAFLGELSVKPGYP